MPKPTPQDFITWTNTLVQFPWPIQLNDFPPPTPNNSAGHPPHYQTNSAYVMTAMWMI